MTVAVAPGPLVGFEREEATDPGPIELPPRDIKDMTGRELAEWAVLSSLVRRQEYGSDTIIVFDGLLRTMAFAKDLRSPLLYQAIRNAEPLSEIRGWQQTANLWRRFERPGRTRHTSGS